MGLFGHSELTGGKTLDYNIEDVRRHVTQALGEMGCHSFSNISENDFTFKTSTSFRYNMNPGSGELSLTDTGSGTSVRLRVYISQKAFSRIETWISDCIYSLERKLTGYKHYSKKTIPTANFVATNEVLVKCPSCGYEFSVNNSLTICFCQKCGTKLVREQEVEPKKEPITPPKRDKSDLHCDDKVVVIVDVEINGTTIKKGTQGTIDNVLRGAQGTTFIVIFDDSNLPGEYKIKGDYLELLED